MEKNNKTLSKTRKERLNELKKKINTKEYLDHAIDKIATDITLFLFK